MPRTPILIDCDPGQDDAVMLMLAMNAPELEILGITAVGGNVPLAWTEANARRICELMGRRDLPVFAGCDRPLVRPLVTAAHVHGEDGLMGLTLPAPTMVLQRQHAVDFIVETLRARDDVVLCPVGPLTNIAMALTKAPDIARRVRRIVLMGGAIHGGNVTPVAEYNIYADPDAAAVVFASGAPIVMIGLDCTHQALIGPDQIAALKRAGTTAAKATVALFDFPERWRPHLYGGRVGFPVHDACVVGWLLDPQAFAGRDCRVDVETASELTLGQTVVDWHGKHGGAPNAQVIRDVDAPRFLDELLRRLSRP
ncbi:MAG: nucleoside hydrolase [Alphaproteobacteria bacterium]|nr:nucleoside hydrolase [Alphaproteobacteria bacterium]